MPGECGNLYGRYRRAAGLTQERAAELLGCAVRSLANWEYGLYVPPDDKVVLMCDVYQAPTLAIEHLRATTALARMVLPEYRKMTLSTAVCGLLASIRDFISSESDWALLDIAADGIVEDTESVQFKLLMGQLDKIVAAATELKFAEGAERWIT